MRSQRSAAVGAVRARPLCLSGVRLGPTEGRSPTSLAELTIRREPYRVEFDFSCREWTDCLVECEQLGSAGSMKCNMFSGRQQTRARERVLNRTLQSNTQDTLQDSLQGGTRFLFEFRGFLVHLEPTKPKTVGPGVVSLRFAVIFSFFEFK